jgi:FixJ family two-component response regulator
MARFGSTVFIVDDQPAARASAAALVSSLGFDCETFSSAKEFFDAVDILQAGCAIIDLHLPEMDAFALQEHLVSSGSAIAVVFVGADISVQLAVRAMRLGAISVLEKPYNADQLAEAICKSAAISRIAHATKHRLTVLRGRFEMLNSRERRVMMMVVEGVPNKTIAHKLDVCQRTAAQLRADVFEKMGADSAVDLAVMARDLWRLDSAETLLPPIVSGALSMAEYAR